MISKFLPSVAVSLFLLGSCSTFSSYDRFEGPVSGKNRIRVYVQFDEYDIYDAAVRKKIAGRLQEEGFQRFSMMVRQIAAGLSDEAAAGDLALLAEKKDLPSEIVFRRIDEEKVEGFIDFIIPEHSAAAIRPLFEKKKKEKEDDE